MVKNYAALGLMTLILAGCAGTGQGEIADPLEPMNRGIFAFNDTVDEAIIEPVARGYHEAVPKPARVGLRNVLRNLKSPVVIANDILQGNATAAGNDTTRLFANTFFGLGGLIDVAGADGVAYNDEDFGQTLGAWGVDQGAYLVLPLLGPSSLRDTTGLIVDSYADPLNRWMMNTDREGGYYARIALAGLDKREELLDVLADLKKNSIDYYAAIKSAYAQRREAQVSNNMAGVEDMP
ncbi:MAG: VacJ family lipoprotein [Pseudobdellovibrionaceae bacterium]